jgi:UDP-arabinose 4-epimerase
MNTVVVTGGAGYVGSHCAKAFATAGWRVVTVDNLCRGWRDAVRWGPLIEADIADEAAMSAVFAAYKPDLVAHFAAFAYVGESMTRPEIYYGNNVAGSLRLLEAMRGAGLKNIIFSSSCATYGHPQGGLIDETQRQSPINPYGWSKLMVEQMHADYAQAHGFNAIALRYFNAAGCDPAGELGERHEPETHVIPLAIEAALDPSRAFTVNGTDFPTPDGSAIRDFIHVADLARAHLKAGERVLLGGGYDAVNLGTGKGVSVLEIVAEVERQTGRRIRVAAGPPRPGDPAALVAAPGKAHDVLGWRAEESGLEHIIATALAWRMGEVKKAVAVAN